MGTERLERPRGRPRDPLIEEAILRAAHQRLAAEGYSRMTIGNVAADAGVTRPTVYRRWSTKHDLVVDALDYRFRAEQAAYPPMDLDAMSAREAVIEAVRRANPRGRSKTGITLIGNVLAESEHAPGFLDLVREHAVKPRRKRLLDTLRAVQARGGIRTDLDLDLFADLCMGTYFAAYVRTGEDNPNLPARVVDTLWSTMLAA
ncbi:MAG: hypothetical protein QOI83_1092 [Streptomycetaceae bacterium]|nr:hypothetical protein [Streptomycetaceae bacterium]